MSEEHTEELFTRLRETEAQTREQNVKLSSLSDKVEKLSETNQKYIDLLKAQMDSADKREQMLMRTIYVLVGAVIALALGIKYVEKFFPATADASHSEIRYDQPIMSNHNWTELA